jgi:hypothetical protein
MQAPTLSVFGYARQVVTDPQGRSQFSFDGGRSACTFLVIEAALHLSQKLSGGEILCTQVCVCLCVGREGGAFACLFFPLVCVCVYVHVHIDVCVCVCVNVH